MNDKLFRTILKRYEAEIEDANYKIEAICEHNLVIPEHVDITGEIDKQLERIAGAEDKLSAMRKYYGEKRQIKQYCDNYATIVVIIPHHYSSVYVW